MKATVRLCIWLLLSLVPGVSIAADAIGKVDRVQGPCQGIVGGTTSDLTSASPVFLDEVISTGADGRLALTFDDGTVLTVGEQSKITLDEFVYRPAGESRLRLAVIGSFRYVSGKLQPAGTRVATVETAVATIGVRGTDFWGGPIDGRFGVVVFEGSVTVTTAGGSVDLGAVNQGVNIDGTTPGTVTIWPQEKRDRALATVTFR